MFFGSYSMEEYDEGRVIDLLIVFKDKPDLDKGLSEIYETTAKIDLFTCREALLLLSHFWSSLGPF